MEKFRGSTKSKFLLLKKNGQFAIEAVLLMTILMGIFLTFLKYTRDNKMLQKVVSDPVAKKLEAVTGFGTWRPDGCTAPGKSQQTLGKCHPNSIHRSLSSDPGF
jgi:hypothetical protein